MGLTSLLAFGSSMVLDWQGSNHRRLKCHTLCLRGGDSIIHVGSFRSVIIMLSLAPTLNIYLVGLSFRLTLISTLFSNTPSLR